MNECRLENQKYLSARLETIFRNDILEIRAHTLLVTHAKAVPLRAICALGVPAKDELAASLRPGLMASEDFKEGIAAFKQKREPRWPSMPPEFYR